MKASTTIFEIRWNTKQCNSKSLLDMLVSGQAAQPVPLASLKLSIAVYGQKLDGRPSG